MYNHLVIYLFSQRLTDEAIHSINQSTQSINQSTQSINQSTHSINQSINQSTQSTQSINPINQSIDQSVNRKLFSYNSHTFKLMIILKYYRISSRIPRRKRARIPRWRSISFWAWLARTTALCRQSGGAPWKELIFEGFSGWVCGKWNISQNDLDLCVPHYKVMSMQYKKFFFHFLFFFLSFFTHWQELCPDGKCRRRAPEWPRDCYSWTPSTSAGSRTIWIPSPRLTSLILCSHPTVTVYCFYYKVSLDERTFPQILRFFFHFRSKQSHFFIKHNK